MSTTITSPACEATLDRAQREALRRQFEIVTGGCGDILLCIEKRDRAAARRLLEEVGQAIRAMDVIGWTEQPDAADEAPVWFSRRLASWARREAVALRVSLSEFVPADADLDALTALDAMAAAGGDA